MKIEIRILNEDDSVSLVIPVPDLTQEMRWQASTIEDHLLIDDERYLCGFAWLPFLDTHDARDNSVIEEENSAGGFGAQRAAAAHIPHRASTPRKGK
jgi:hypothetical protein